MNKSELIEDIAAKSGVSKAAATRMLDATMDTIRTEVAKGNPVTLIGFGTFSSTKRAARTGRNPQTGVEMRIEAKTSPTFKAGKTFKDAVNK